MLPSRNRQRAARWVTNQHDGMSTVTAMLKELDWTPLELRRADFRLCLKLQMVLWHTLQHAA